VHGDKLAVDSLFGDHHIHGPEGLNFYTRGKVVTSRWSQAKTAPDASLQFPAAS
jgi:malonate-semialdehyde dehydrogenase (acetylating)/methylmalonate-semialdehyde dehydrogenase